MKDDRSLLKHAIRIADKGIEDGYGPFGAVIAKDGNIIAQAKNKVVLSHDPTAHAEVLAIRKASSLLKTHDLSECVLYASCEPCPMCLGAIYWSGIRKVVYASDRNDAERSGFSDKFIYDEIGISPSLRKISFIRIQDTEGEKVFKKWDEFENRIPY
ncbi:MAG: nucleoside deaminase [Bacteroidia bacterium]|nr:nucleoside deaminase [Bacteroidia bacterium]